MSAHLPMSRIKTIIKSSADVDVVAKESIYLITRAAELFIKHLAKEAYDDTDKAKKLDYKNVANVVNTHMNYEFLREIIPKKITVRDYFKLIKEQGAPDVNYVSSSNEDSSSSSASTEGDDSSDDEEEKNKASSDSDVIILD